MLTKDVRGGHRSGRMMRSGMVGCLRLMSDTLLMLLRGDRLSGTERATLLLLLLLLVVSVVVMRT